MLTVRPGTERDEADALALWQADLARRGERSGGTRATAFRQRLRSPRALLLVAEEGGRTDGVALVELAAPGTVELGVLACRPGSTAARALLRAVTGRFDRVTAWTPDPGPYELAGFARTGAERDGEVELQREAPSDQRR